MKEDLNIRVYKDLSFKRMEKYIPYQSYPKQSTHNYTRQTKQTLKQALEKGK